MDWKVTGHEATGDVMLLPLWQAKSKAPHLSLNGLARSAISNVKSALSGGRFDGKIGSTLSIWSDDCRVVLIGMGKADDLTHKIARDAGAKAIAGLSKKDGTNLTVRFTTGWNLEGMKCFIEGMMLRDYTFLKYRKKAREEAEEKGNWKLTIQASERYLNDLQTDIKIIAARVDGVHIARDLGNEPPNHLYPMAYAERAQDWAKGKNNVKVEVYDWDRLQKEEMGGLINVGKGSSRKPCMVIFTVNPQVDPKAQVPCIVGKGITFDTGGISLKPGASMDEMKYDMHGAATVFGLMHALHASGYKGRVHGIACLAENMPSAEAYRPGDVIPTYSGKTIEVLNTDAEGRNVLADGLWKSGELNPEYVIDLATLTGAVVVALGHEATGLWSNNDDLQERIHKAGNEEDEIAWKMPLLPAFEKEMTGSKIADVRNLGKSRWGGSCTAAAFLKQFVPPRDFDEDNDQIPWAHLDIAGTAWGADTNSMVGHGATGIHVRTLHRLITGS
tara:strand:+ start:526 stop:2031 length:1506 start_codon:yes stop_codon:yes gene_type:complete